MKDRVPRDAGDFWIELSASFWDFLSCGGARAARQQVKVAITRYYELQSEQDTIDLAERLAPLLRPGDLICLLGDLGAGKTFFAQALGRFLGAEEELDSPSFMLLKEYACRDFPSTISTSTGCNTPGNCWTWASMNSSRRASPSSNGPSAPETSSPNMTWNCASPSTDSAGEWK